MGDQIQVNLRFFRGPKGNVVSKWRRKYVIPLFRALENNIYPVTLIDRERYYFAVLRLGAMTPVAEIRLLLRGRNKVMAVYRLVMVFLSGNGGVMGKVYTSTERVITGKNVSEVILKIKNEAGHVLSNWVVTCHVPLNGSIIASV